MTGSHNIAGSEAFDRPAFVGGVGSAGGYRHRRPLLRAVVRGLACAGLFLVLAVCLAVASA